MIKYFNLLLKDQDKLEGHHLDFLHNFQMINKINKINKNNHIIKKTHEIY
jgi:hypothetical protein